MTDWIEVTVQVDGEGAEAVADLLQRYAHQGVSIEQVLDSDSWPDEAPADQILVRAYLPEGIRVTETVQKIRKGLYYLSRLYDPIPEPSIRTISEEDWADAWKEYYHPIRVGKRILIKPAWSEPDIAPDDIVIEMDPGMAFGTGTHPTTQLCLQACEWFVRPGTSMIDLGTGSGILAIAAAKLGAYQVLARDIDELAVKAAQENVDRNGVADIVTVQQGSLDGLITSPRRFGFGMVNIIAKVIIEMAHQKIDYIVWPGSRFIFSGIIENQVDEVVEALGATELDLLGTRQMGDWVMLITERQRG